MKIIFIDVENIGVKELDKIEASIIDKVFVFSNSDTVRLLCEKALYQFIGGYPTGANQADFYIIAYLSRVLLTLDKKQTGNVEIKLYSNDENLIMAFEFQCNHFGASYHIVRTKEPAIVPNANPPSVELRSPVETFSLEELKSKLLELLQSPHTLSELRQRLNLSQSEFTRAVHALVSTDQIKRLPESKKKWVSSEINIVHLA